MSVRKVILFISLYIFLIYSNLYGEILENWRDADAYKPNPILFLHGFSLGAPASWDKIVNELNKYFDDYTKISTSKDLSKPYLERLAFNDPNGSIDTYDDGRDGWADKIKNRVSELIDLYKFKGSSLKINLVSHSMGGLAAREYITNPKYPYGGEKIDKLIAIATPHAGSPFANIKKLEDATTGEHKYVWDVPACERGITALDMEITDNVLQLLRGRFRLDPEGEDVKDMAVGSIFLKTLNARIQGLEFNSYAIQGEVWHFLNGLFGAYYPNEDPFICGDGIVPRDSQIGIDIMTNYPDMTPKTVWSFDSIKKIAADHFSELDYKDTPLEILKFLDSAKPKFEITSPNPNGTTEIYESSIHIQGKVYKEYLPADSKLTINIVREDDNYPLPPQISLLRPSDLWIPNDSDSPVAEFDEVVTFPGKGTYKISCHIKNPAGEVSDTKDVWVKVLYEGTNIIVHCHNPEGKEINSISTAIVDFTQWWQVDAEIYDGDIHISNGASRIEDHNRPIPIDPGNHTIKAVFNGMTLQQDIDISEGETEILTFTFERTEFDIAAWLDTFDDGDNTFERSGEGYIEWPDEFHEELTEELSSGSIVISKVNIDTSGFFPNGGHDYSYHNRIIQTFNSTTYKNETYAQLTISGEELPNRSYSSVWVDNRRSHPIDLPTNISFTYWFSQYKENYRYPKISLVSGDIEYPIIWNRYNFDPPYLTGHEVWMMPANRNYTLATWWGWGAFAMAFQNTEVEETYAYTLTDIKMSSVPYDLEEVGF